MSTVTDRIEFLWENWINGNRKDVVEEILKESTAKACVITACLFSRMMEEDENDGDSVNCSAFMTLLENRS